MARRKKSLSDFDPSLVAAGVTAAIARDTSTKPDDVELELPEGFSVESETKSKARVRDIDEVEHVHDKPVSPFAPTVTQSVNQPTERHQTIAENQKGILFDPLFAP